MKSLILGIVLKGLTVFSDERRTAFKRKYKKTLDKRSSAENIIGSEYNDADIDVSEEELINILKAYGNEITHHNNSI